MKLTFPHMGPLVIYKRLLEAFDHEVIMPQKPTQRTIDLGAKHSPEFLCFPFKCLMGTYIESVERGAEGVVTTGGDGACRAGFYAEVHQRILKSLGYDVRFFVFDSLFLHPREFIGHIRVLKGSYSWWYFLKTFRFCYLMLAALDRLEGQIRLLRAYEETKGDFTRVWDRITGLFDQCRSVREIPELEEECLRLIRQVPLRPQTQPAVKVGIVGEIYVTMEGHANLEIEQKLAALGVQVVNSQYVSHWLQDKISLLPWKKPYVEKILQKATPYLKINLGGHDKENIAHMIAFREQGIDGIIHLMPFACLPELVTQSIIPRLSQDLNMPILSLALDEQLGTANNQTRIEAFIDLIMHQKRLSYR